MWRRLIGHENDVQDVAWSPDSSILVSVGLDSRVVVWSGYTFEKLKTLASHSSHVKGITFDPAGKYFATASDDRTIKIFRYTPIGPNTSAHDSTTNFMPEVTITDPFKTSPITTYFRRCSWSPEGTHIAAANATNGPVTTAAIINRGTWDSDINLVGHEGPIEVCAFSPRIFARTERELAGPSSASSVTVIACAGQDRALSIWNTSNSKPLIVNEGLSMKPISDLAWAPDGQNVFFTSLDGTIALVRFGPGDLGWVLPQETTESTLAKFGAGRKMGLVEGPDALILEEQSKSDELKNVQGRMGELMGDPQSTAPVAVNSAPNGVPVTVNGISGKDKDKDVVMNGTGEEPSKKPDERVEKLKQKVTVTKDGKKRVTPLLVSSTAGSTESTLPSSQLRTATTAKNSGNDEPATILDLSKPYDGLPKGGMPSLLIGTKRKLAETGEDDDNQIQQRNQAAERQGASSILMNTSDGLVTATRALAQSVAAGRPSLVDPAATVSQMRLAVPHIRSHIVRPISGRTRQIEGSEQEKSSTDEHIFEVRNPTSAAKHGRSQEPARITVSRKGQVLWWDYVPRPILLITGNARFWAACCDDGTLYVWTPAGRRMFNAFAMEAQPVILDSRGPWLLAVTSIGMCHVWNVSEATSPHPPVSLAPVMDIASHSFGPHLAGGPSIIFARLNSQGRLVVAVSNGDAYTWSPSMFVWQRLSEAWWAVGSQYWNTNESNLSTQSAAGRNSTSAQNDDEDLRWENISAGIIPLLERNTTSQTLLRGRAHVLQRLVQSLLSEEGYEGFESAVSVAHVENRLAGALSLGAKDEFKLYLLMYAKRLGAEGARLKTEELLRSLTAGGLQDGEAQQRTMLVDGYAGHQAKGPADELCGWKRSTLLREVVLILGESCLAVILVVVRLTNRDNVRQVSRAAAHDGAIRTHPRHHERTAETDAARGQAEQWRHGHGDILISIERGIIRLGIARDWLFWCRGRGYGERGYDSRDVGSGTPSFGLMDFECTMMTMNASIACLVLVFLIS